MAPNGKSRPTKNHNKPTTKKPISWGVPWDPWKSNINENPVIQTTTTATVTTTLSGDISGAWLKDNSSHNKQQPFTSSNEIPIIGAAIGSVAFIFLCAGIGVLIWRRRKTAKPKQSPANDVDASHPYYPDSYVRDDKLKTISALITVWYTKVNDYCYLKSNTRKKTVKENMFTLKIVWSQTKQSHNNVDPPFADYSTIFSGKV